MIKLKELNESIRTTGHVLVKGLRCWSGWNTGRQKRQPKVKLITRRFLKFRTGCRSCHVDVIWTEALIPWSRLSRKFAIGSQAMWCHGAWWAMISVDPLVMVMQTLVMHFDSNLPWAVMWTRASWGEEMGQTHVFPTPTYANRLHSDARPKEASFLESCLA